MDQYRTSGFLNEKNLNEVKRFFILPQHWFISAIFAILCVILAVLNFLAWNTTIAFLCAIVFTALVMMPYLGYRQSVKVILDRIRENCPDGRQEAESYFDQEGIHLRNLTNGANSVLAYSSLAYVGQSKNLFFIMTKSQQFFLVFKDCLTQEQQESFLPFLKEHCPKLKVRR